MEADSDSHPTLHLGGFDNHGTTRAQIQGRWIEVEHGIPGESVRAEIIGQKRPRARILEIIDPAPDRIEPPCEYFRDWSCGGCQWQHISYEGQLRRKRQEVETTIQATGIDLAVHAVHASVDPWRYRTTAGIALGKQAGFRRQASLAIVPLHDCPISHPLIGILAARLNDALDTDRLPNFRGRVRLDVQVSVAGGDYRLQVLIRPDPDRLPPADELDMLTTFLTGLEFVAAVLRAGQDEHVKVVTGDLFGQALIGDRLVTVSAASFFQTNLGLLPTLIQRVCEEAGPLREMRVADIYGGVGTFGLFLAEEAQEVVVIESDPITAEAGRRTAQEWGLENVIFVADEAEDVLDTSGRFDVVIVDPPRSGLSAPVMEAMTEIRPPVILYVSCLARSLARDLGPLTASGYRVHLLELFDFYPQTYHVELLAVLRRR